MDHSLTNPNVITSLKKFIQGVTKPFYGPFNLSSNGLVPIFMGPGITDKLVGVFLHLFDIGLVGHPESRFNDTHIDPVALHVVEETRRIVIGLHHAHDPSQIAVILGALEGLSRGMTLGMDVCVNNKSSKFHVLPPFNIIVFVGCYQADAR